MSLYLLLALCLPQEVLLETQHCPYPWVASRIDLEGNGYNGTDPTGPLLCFHGTDGLQLGSGAAYRATGSKLERLRIVTTGNGGTAVQFFARSAAERPGESVIRDVKILGLSDLQGGTPQRWEHGLVIDGGDLNETNQAGARTFLIEGLRVAGCLGDSIRLTNVTHFFGRAIEIDQGKAPRVPSMIVERSRHIFLDQVNVFGELHLRGCQRVLVRGYVQTLYVDANCRDVLIEGIVDRLVVDGRGPYVGATGRSTAIVKDRSIKSLFFELR